MRNYLYKLLLCILPFIVSCSHDQLEVYEENINYRPAGDFLRNNYDLSLFAAAVEKVGMMEELNSEGPFTILAPGNQAFHELGIQRPSDFDRLDQDSLRFMVRYHILDRRLQSSDIPVAGVDVRYTTLADGKEIYVSHAAGSGSSNRYFFNGCFASPQDVVVINGSVHVLNKAMKYEQGTVRDWLEKREQFSIITAAFKKFGFWELLAGEGPFTIFAPDDAAFLESGIDLDSIARMDTTAFIGNRLFGAYIQRNRNFFMTDFQVFSTNNSEYFFEQYVYGDSYYLQMSANMDFDTGGMNFDFGLRSAKDWPYTSLTTVYGRESVLQDNLTDNGIVQPMGGVAVQPAEALK